MTCMNCNRLCKVEGDRIVNDCRRPMTDPIDADAEHLCPNFHPVFDVIRLGGKQWIWDADARNYTLAQIHTL